MCQKNNLLSIMCFVFAVSFCVVSAQICGESLLLKPNGTYDTNRRLILSALAFNVSSRDGFYSGSVGEGTERTYALGLCIPGTDPMICSDCIQSASNVLLQNCLNHTDSFDWRGDTWRGDRTLCYVRYSNRLFFDSMELEPSRDEYYDADITGNFTDFNRIWEEFMERMIVAASSESHTRRRRHYAAGMTPWTRFLNIHALMQCIPGISSKECDACLRANVRKFQQCCSGKQGAGIERPVCYFRWDLFSFLGAFDNITSSPPPQSLQDPQSKKGGKQFPIWGIVLIPLAVLVIVLGVFVYCKKMKKKKKNQSMKRESKFGANPESFSSDAKTNADLHDRTDGKVKPPNIQVFVNFRGEQLRNNFVSYLVEALRRSEINVFIDNQEQRGEDLNTLFKRIEDSGIAIVVFSSRYSESEWCLNELVKIKERVQQGLLKVLPIFYKVTPGNVKDLKGEFGDYFRDKEHKYASDEPKIKRWKEAIVYVSHKFALTFDDKSSALESEFIENIIKEVMKVLQAIFTVESGQSSR